MNLKNRKLFTIWEIYLFIFFQFWDNYTRQDHQNVKMTINLHSIYIFEVYKKN